MPYKPTEKVYCKQCGGWVAEVDTRTKRIVRARYKRSHEFRRTVSLDTSDEGEIRYTHAYAYCSKCKTGWEWELVNDQRDLGKKS